VLDREDRRVTREWTDPFPEPADRRPPLRILEDPRFFAEGDDEAPGLEFFTPDPDPWVA
jgi:hypothetical protein